MSGGEDEPVTPGTAPRWSRDGRHVYFGRSGDTWVTSAAGGSERPVTDLAGRPGRTAPGIAVGAEVLYFSWGQDTGDLWVMDVVRE